MHPSATTFKLSPLGLLQHHFPVSVVIALCQGLIEEGEVEIGSIRQEQGVNITLSTEINKSIIQGK